MQSAEAALSTDSVYYWRRFFEGRLRDITTIKGRLIFRDDFGRDRFVERIDRAHQYRHFLLRVGPSGQSCPSPLQDRHGPPTYGMARLPTGHAVGFNKRCKHHGSLFQNRYKSVLCQEDSYLTELVCDAQLNPIRAHTLLGVSLDSLRSGSRRDHVVEARSLFCFRAVIAVAGSLRHGLPLFSP
jgi:hypothetical protein